MTRPQIILVGNGSSLIGSGKGNLIDSHQYVARCNNFQTRDHEEDVGCRTTHLCRRGMGDIKLFIGSELKSVINIIAHCAHILHMDMIVKKKLIPRYGEILTVVSEQETVELTKDVGLVYKNEEGRWFETATVGLVSIAYLLTQFKKISITGFDFVEDINLTKYEHYYKRKPPGGSHNLRKEAVWIRSMVKQGRVEILPYKENKND